MMFFANRSGRVSMAEAIALFQTHMVARKFSPSTYAMYTRTLEQLGEHCRKRPGRMSTNDLRAFLKRWENNSSQTYNLKATTIRTFFKFLFEEELVETNPALRVKSAKRQERKVTRITTAEMHALFDACVTMPERLCVGTAILTGSRRNALANVRWKDVDLAKRTITFVEKGSKRITKPLHPALLELYLEFVAAHNPAPEDWVIPNRDPHKSKSGKRSNRIVYALVKQVAERVAVKTHVHALRAGFAVMCLERGADLLTVQKLLGHESPATTQKYIDEFDNAQAMREALGGMDFGQEGAA